MEKLTFLLEIFALIQLPVLISTLNLPTSTYPSAIINGNTSTSGDNDTDVIDNKVSTNSDLLINPDHFRNDETENDLGRLCAFMNVSHNASYKILDREEFSVGLSQIHNTSDIFEIFNYVTIEEGCEVTICELQILNSKGRVRKCFTLNDSQSLDNVSNTAPDPFTRQYFVSTGCSCQDPPAGCNSTKCSDVTLEDHECGRLYKEPHCSECRYDVKSLNDSESFIPSNTFWCQSFVIKDGCRMSIDTMGSSGLSNVRNYTGRINYIEMDYVRYPNPSTFTCLCDADLSFQAQNSDESHSIIKWIVPLSICAMITIVSAISAILFQKYGVAWIKKKMPHDPGIDYVIEKFQNGYASKTYQNLSDDGGGTVTNYVSIGFVSALNQPYQHKWEIPRENITMDEKKILGIGQFGVVCLGKMTLPKDGQTDVAVKTAKVSSDISHFSLILDEIKILAFIEKHPNICSLIGACTQNIKEREVLIVLELCSNGNLKNYLKNNKTSFLEPIQDSTDNAITIMTNASGYAAISTLKIDEYSYQIKPPWFANLLKWSMQIACGMQYLSMKQVIHIDLAARNILLTDSLDCKIGDFGLSQKLHEVVNYVRIGNEYPLPVRWLALESLQDLKFSTQSDVWSYGVTLFEIFSLGEDPYCCVRGVESLIQSLKNGERLQKPSYCSNEIYEIMLECWDSDPQNRPGFSNLKAFFEDQQSEQTLL